MMFLAATAAGAFGWYLDGILPAVGLATLAWCVCGLAQQMNPQIRQ